MEKIILVVYVGIKNLDKDEIEQHLEVIYNGMKNDETINYIIPTYKNNEIEIKCLNPKLVSEEDYKESKEMLENTQKIVNDLVKKFNK